MRFFENAAKLAVLATAFLSSLPAANFGTVVQVGGHVSDIAIDERRQVVYLSNFGARRIEVVSMADNKLQSPISLDNQPCCLALSSDQRYLIAGSYGFGPGEAVPQKGITVVDLDNGQRRNIALGVDDAPLAAAFGAGVEALVVTNTGLLMVEPSSGAVTNLTPGGYFSLPLPTSAPRFPPQILQASTAVSGNGQVVYVMLQGADPSEAMVIRFDVGARVATILGSLHTPNQGPRVISTNSDGSYFVAGGSLFTSSFVEMAEFPYPTGSLNIGSNLIDDQAKLIYAQVPRSATSLPELAIYDSDNLTLRQRLQVKENLAGRSMLTRDRQTMYAVSDSGVLVLPIGKLAQSPRIVAVQEDLIFRGNFCNRDLISQFLDVVDPGGNLTPFTFGVLPAGVRVSQTSGTTPARIRVDIDPLVFSAKPGTTELFLDITSTTAVNFIPLVRLLVNNRQPEQRGSIVNVPGRLVDLVADQGRNRFYLLRQDKNEVLVFDANSFTQIATFRTGNTPVQMAMTQDSKFLIVTNSHSQIASVFDLDTLVPSAPIIFPQAHHPVSIVVSPGGIFAIENVSSPPIIPAGLGAVSVARIQFANRIATTLPTLGIYLNNLQPGAMLFTSSSGTFAYLLEASGRLFLYDSTVDNFVAARDDVAGNAGGFGAPTDEYFIVGNSVYNRSLVSQGPIPGDGLGLGYATAKGLGLRVADSAGQGIIGRFDLNTLERISPTGIAEAPIGAVVPPATQGQVGLAFPGFFRNLATLGDNRPMVVLSTSGFTIVPWDFDGPTVTPTLSSLVNLADGTARIAPGSLISLRGNNLSQTTLGAGSLPLPTFLAETCVSVNNVFLPMSFVSPNEIRGQLPYSAIGTTRIIARTPGGTSQPLQVNSTTAAPALFRSGTAGSITDIATVYRATNGELVTDSNPVHPKDIIIIYLTGLGVTTPATADGYPGGFDPLAFTAAPAVKLGGVNLTIAYSGLVPGQVGVYQINAIVPNNVPEGGEIPLEVSLGGDATEIAVRVLK